MGCFQFFTAAVSHAHQHRHGTNEQHADVKLAVQDVQEPGDEKNHKQEIAAQHHGERHQKQDCRGNFGPGQRGAHPERHAGLRKMASRRCFQREPQGLNYQH
jgi:hypothetical protein